MHVSNDYSIYLRFFTFVNDSMSVINQVIIIVVVGPYSSFSASRSIEIWSNSWVINRVFHWIAKWKLTFICYRESTSCCNCFCSVVFVAKPGSLQYVAGNECSVVSSKFHMLYLLSSVLLPGVLNHLCENLATAVW